MIQTSGFALGVGASASVYKAGASINGVQVKLGVNNVFIKSGSILLNPDGTDYEDVAPFGDGVFLNNADKNNQMYVGIPTVTDAVPIFGGIIVRSMGVEGSYPNNGEGVTNYNKFNIARDGYWRYRSGKDVSGNSIAFDSDYIIVGAYAYVSNTDGSIAFGSAATVAGFTTIGRISELDPDDESWVVHLDADNSVYTASA